MQKLLVRSLALLICLLLVPQLVLARVIDDGKMLKPETITQLDQKIDTIHSNTGKEILVVTVPNLGGQTERDVASKYVGGGLNGVEIFMARDEHKLDINMSNNTRDYISDARRNQIRSQMLGYFRQHNFDQGVLAGVDAIGQALPANSPRSQNPLPYNTPYRGGQPYAPPHRGINWGGLILLAIIIFFVISLIRAIGQRAMGGGSYVSGPGYGGGPVVGGGGYYPPSGGGGLMTGLLGGLGGAVVGNWLYDKFSGRENEGNYGGNYGGGGYADPNYGGNVGGGGSESTYQQSADTGMSYDTGGSWDSGSSSSSAADTGGWGGGGDSGGSVGGSFDSGGGGGGGDW